MSSDIDPEPPAGTSRRARVWRRAVLAVLGILAVAGAILIWVGIGAVQARDQLTLAGQEVVALQRQVATGDRAAATHTMSSLQQHAATARDATHGPHWSVASRLPWIGANVAAVQAVSEVVSGLARDALPALLTATQTVDPARLAPVDGRIDLEPLRRAKPTVLAADAEVRAAAKKLDTINTSDLLEVLAAPVQDLRTKLDDLALTTSTAARAVQLLPAMLGGDGPRQYLLLAQNNSEQRATGGVPTLLLLRADQGAVQIVESRSAGGKLAYLPHPALPLTAEEQALFSVKLGTYMADVTFTPDFPRSGELAQAIWRQQIGSELDGVLSVDPGALANILGATGPVKLPDGQQLSKANAVPLLENTVYLDILDPVKQDQFFTGAAGAVFQAVMSGQGKPKLLVDALAESARQGRVMLWSAHPQEQALIAGTVLSGELAGADGTSPVVGVYLNDGTASKIGYYLKTDVVVTDEDCAPGGSRVLRVTITLTSTAPQNAAAFPPYLSSGLVVPKGEVKTNVLLYAPTGGWVDEVTVRNGSPGGFAQTHDGLAVVGRTVQLKPGQQTVIDAVVRTGPGYPGQPVVRMTPVALGGSSVKTMANCR